MNQFQPQTKVDTLYRAFLNQPYLPQAYWTTQRGFELDLLSQHSVADFRADATLPKGLFVLDCSLVPPPGTEPGSSDFQSGA